jgi:hypothetical protein
MGDQDNVDPKVEGEEPEEEKAITAGYRPFWGTHGMWTLFTTLFMFPLGVVGWFLIAPVFFLLMMLCIVMFVGGVVMVELEHRDPKVPDHDWQEQYKKKKEEPKEEEPKEK